LARLSSQISYCSRQQWWRRSEHAVHGPLRPPMPPVHVGNKDLGAEYTLESVKTYRSSPMVLLLTWCSRLDLHTAALLQQKYTTVETRRKGKFTSSLADAMFSIPLKEESVVKCKAPLPHSFAPMVRKGPVSIFGITAGRLVNCHDKSIKHAMQNEQPHKKV
jgi:hypothetical protein